ncbi:hypothetical protein [Natronomonas sp.]|uniref:hypothetical protein n=1 Tax=Natronomonas sp. TaxID=2184060 RepID=UPI0039895529
MFDATKSCFDLVTVVFIRLPISSVIQIEKYAMVRSNDVPVVVSRQNLVPGVLKLWIRREIIRPRRDIDLFTA